MLGVASVASVARADDGALHVHMVHEEEADGPLLHLDVVELDPTIGTGGLSDGKQVALSLGPHARLAAEGKWWQTGLAPSGFASDLPDHGWRAGGELSYDFGWFSLGMNVSMTHDITGSHRMVGLFAYKRFNLSRWMHAWIALGLSFDRYDDTRGTRSGTTLGLSLGTTFR